jgi:glycosyltransferase involved in cell wall biosynthesis
MAKKVLFIVNKDNVIYNFRRELAFALIDHGYEVYISSPYGKKIDYMTERGCKFINMDIDRRGTSIINDMKLIWDYYVLLKDLRPDIVLTYTTKCSTYGGIVCRWLGIPYIVNNAGIYGKDDFNKLIWFILKLEYKLSFAGASCLMYQNSYERDTLNKIIGKKVHYLTIPGSGVNLNEFEFKPYPADNSTITFNYVGRLVSIKGIDEFLNCAEKIKSKYQNTRFMIYGDYDEDIYRQRINDLQKKGIVEYAGIQMNMKPFIENAHAVIHASYYEGMTNVVLEHGAMGRVCIGSDIPGIKEGIEDGMTGFLFPCKDLDALVATVEKFINLPYSDKVSMGKAAREMMVREFDRIIVTNIYIEEINKILAKQNIT